MIKKNFFALILATTSLVLGYLNYISSFISLGVCIVSFFCALLLGIKEFLDTYIITQSQKDEKMKNLILSVQEELKIFNAKQNEGFNKLTKNLTQNNDSIVNVVQKQTEAYTNLFSIFKSLENVIKMSAESLENLTSKLDNFNSNIDKLSNESKSHLDSVKSNREKIVGTIESFNRDINELKKVHEKLASQISESSNSNKKSITDLIDEIKEILKDGTESIQELNKELIGNQISENEKAIKKLRECTENSINNLSRCVLDLLGYVEEIKNNTLDIDKADKDLLEKISKICE